MKTILFVSGASLLSLASASNFSQYSPGPGVEAAFKPYLMELYNQTELLKANTTFTDFFTPTGEFIAGPTVSQGANNIINLKYQLLPPNSGQIWTHRPNKTTVLSENTSQKVYQVFGIIEKNLNGFMGVNNCSEQFYQSNFTIKKINGVVQLQTHDHNLMVYNDYGLEPAKAPTNIKCGSP